MTNPTPKGRQSRVTDGSLPFRVFLYSRVSSPRQAQQGESLESQPVSLRLWAQAQGWNVVGEITDPGRSGRTEDREGFQKLMTELKRLRPDAVLVTRLSRFMRNARLTLNAIHEMRQLGVALICMDEPIDTRHRGIADMILAILATMAEWDSERLSEYAKETYNNLVAKGRWPSGSPPYGYSNDKAQSKLVVVPEEAENVRLIYSLYTHNRMGMHSIRKELSARGVKSPKGGKVWSMSLLWRLLTDETYTGRHRLEIPAPAIIDEDLFKRAQELRGANRRLHPPRKDPWPLQNRLRCSLCGSTFKCAYSKGKRYYRCSSRWKSSQYYLQTGEQCEMKGILAEDLELSLLTGICDSMFTPSNFAKALEATISELHAKAEELDSDVEPLRGEMEEIDQELERIELAWVRGRLSQDTLKRLEREALERKEMIQARLDTLDPGDVTELERTRRLIRAAEESLQDARSSGDRWKHKHAPSIWFTDALVLPDHKRPGSLDKETPSDTSSDEIVVYDTIPDLAPEQVADSLDGILDKLEAQVWAGSGKMRVQGMIRLEVPSSEETPYPGIMDIDHNSQDNQAFLDASSSE